MKVVKIPNHSWFGMNALTYFSLCFIPNHVAIEVTATMMIVKIGWFAG